LHLHWSRLPFADRRADGSAGRFCSMLSLSQPDRVVLGSDLNRSESSWGAPGPSPVSGPVSAPSPFGRSHRHLRPVRCPLCLRQRPSWRLALEPRDVRSADSIHRANEVDGPMTSLGVSQALAVIRLRRAYADLTSRSIPAVGTIGLFQAGSARRERR